MRYITTLLILVFAFQTTTAQVVIVRSTEIVSAGAYTYYKHKVSKGETLYSLAKAYEVDEESIRNANPSLANGLKNKQVIIIPTQSTYLAGLKNAPPMPPVELVASAVDSVKWKLDPHKIRRSEQMEPVDSNPFERHPIIIHPHPDDTTFTATYRPQVSGKLRDFDQTQPINVAILLPFHGTNAQGKSYVEFLNGTLIALDELKTRGISTNVDIISVGRESDNDSTYNIHDDASAIIASGRLDNVHLIIGPVRAADMEPFAEWARDNRVALVSPLATVGKINNPYVLQATPCEEGKYAKLSRILGTEGSHTVVISTGDKTDEAAKAEIQRYLDPEAQQVDILSGKALNSLSGMLRVGVENFVVLPCTHEITVSSVLEKIAFLNKTGRYRITVIGLARWSRFINLDTETLFRLNTNYITNYHEDRSDARVQNFYSKYINNFGNLPSMFSMRGYEVTRIFVSSLNRWGSRALLEIGNFDEPLLQVRYKFEQPSPGSNFVNSEWMVVNYTPQFRIVVN